MKGEKLGVYFIYPSGRMNSCQIVRFGTKLMLQITECLQHPVGFGKSLCRGTAICLCWALNPGTLLGVLLLSLRVNHFLPLP